VIPSLDAFERTANAAASVLWPADPAVPGDLGAGDLVDETNGETFAVQWFRWLRYRDSGTPNPDFSLIADSQDAIDVFTELDAQALNRFGAATYADASAGEQLTIMTEALEATLATIYTLPLSAFTFSQLLADVGDTGAGVYWGQNWPYQTVRRNLMAMGTDKQPFAEVNNSVVFSDPANQISNPRDPSKASGFNYQNWFYPLVLSVENQIDSAFVEANNPALAAQSEVDLAGLFADETAKTLYQRLA
jgi:hypothetical protein